MEKTLVSYNYSTKSTIIQSAASMVASLGMLLSGLVLAFPSCMLGPLLDTHTSGFHATVDEASWIASIGAITSPLGCLLGGPMLDKFGRRRGLQLLNIPHIVGWILLMIVPFPVQSIYPLMIGRILTGFGAGLAHCASVTYIAEVTTPQLRTILITFSPVMLSFGIFLAYVLADIIRTEWFTGAGVGIAISVTSFIVTLFLQESPMWLLVRGAPEKANKSLMVMRGTTVPEVVEEEFNQMKQNTSLKKAQTSWMSLLQASFKPEAYKPFIIMNIFFYFQQACGLSVYIVYGVEFAKDAEVYQDAYNVALFIGVVRVLATFVATWASNRWGRRMVAVTSGTATTLGILGLSIYISLRHNHPDIVPASVFIPAFLILLNMFSSSVGFSTLAWSMLGEVFPTKVRGFLSGLTSCIAYFMCFLTIKFYPIVEPEVGNIAVFTFFGINSLIGTIFLAIFLPETHGKTLQEIEDYFRGPKPSKKEILESP